MEWAKPKYTTKEVNWAGTYLIDDSALKDMEKFDRAMDIVNNFRAAHAFPLNTIQTFLREHAKSIDENCIIAQRLKRLYSIRSKLKYFSRMKLGEMQDIGGCRAVVHDLNSTKQLVEAFKVSSIRHRRTHEDNYIQNPKESGYRSWHLVYRYLSDRSEVYNGLKIEVQIRTPLQHAWATAVETVDLFTKQALKSSRGKPEWERFFQLMGTEMALHERTTPVPGTPINVSVLHDELFECEKRLKVVSSLSSFTKALRVIPPSAREEAAGYYLLSLNNVEEELNVIGYKRSELEQASKAYVKIEKQIREKEGTDAVLVSVDSILNLSRAYPNYYADTGTFVEVLKEAIKIRGSRSRVSSSTEYQLPLF